MPASFVLRLSSFVLIPIWLAAQAWGIVLYYKYPPHGVDGLRELTSVLRTESHPGDTVLIIPPILTPPVQQYYQGTIHGLPTDFDLRNIYPPFGDAGWNNQARSALDADVQSASRFWLIYLPADDFKGDFLRGVTATYSQRAYHHYQFADLYLFEK